ncbi:MAG: alanine:cation symporter family protein, partial [Lachnospiraceae bacterium]|nr:alanine:cation symporter family protein [Lachnospiraceae bacterium]
TVHTGCVQKKLLSGIRYSVGGGEKTTNAKTAMQSKKPASAPATSGSEKPGTHKVSGLMALTTTLAATLGTGNIIGVSSAIYLGGPGALFWCFLTGVFGMATSYAECFLSILHRRQNADGSYTGGPMVVLQDRLHKKGLARVYAAAVIFAACCMSCSTQSRAFADAAVSFGLPRIPVGIGLALLIGIIIVGGAGRIHKFCIRIVPAMGGLFLFCCVLILGKNITYLPTAITLMLRCAFSAKAITAGVLSGAFMSALRYGVTRGLFTNEAGLGTAAIAAADAQTPTPQRQALISMTATFWDTVVICALTGLAILTTAIAAPELMTGFSMNELTTAAFLRLSAGGPPLLNLCLMAFAFATLTGWSYFGEKATLFLVGERGIFLYKTFYIVMIFLGTVLSMSLIWELTDFANLFLAIPNLYALFRLRRDITCR